MGNKISNSVISLHAQLNHKTGADLTEKEVLGGLTRRLLTLRGDYSELLEGNNGEDTIDKELVELEWECPMGVGISGQVRIYKCIDGKYMAAVDGCDAVADDPLMALLLLLDKLREGKSKYYGSNN